MPVSTTEGPAGSSTASSHPLPQRLALGFVLLSLLALVVTPVLVQRRIDALRDEVELVVEPARTKVSATQFYLARQMSALRGYMVAEDPAFLERYAAMVQEEEAVRQELEPLAERLGPDVLSLFSRLDLLSEQWHHRSARDPSALLRAGADPRIEAELYDDIIATAAALDEAIAASSREYQATIKAVERVSLYLTAGLVLLALGAALIAAWFGRRVSILAEEAARALRETHAMIDERSRLLRGITHDVKNPLSAADGYAQLLELGLEPLSPRQEAWVAGLRRSLQGTLTMIEELLRFERAGSVEVSIEARLVELDSLVREIGAEHAGAVQAAGHVLEVVTPEAPLWASTDPERMRQILYNLVSNAIKYTPAPGRISLLLESRPEEGGALGQGSWAVVRVSDTGPGIPEEERERIFDEFHRLKPAAAAGHGVGLAISRRLARLMGGRITVEAAAAGGAVFSLWLPLDQTVPAADAGQATGRDDAVFPQGRDAHPRRS